MKRQKPLPFKRYIPVTFYSSIYPFFFLMFGFVSGCSEINPNDYPLGVVIFWCVLGAIAIVLAIYLIIRRIKRQRRGKGSVPVDPTSPTGANSGYDPSTGR